MVTQKEVIALLKKIRNRIQYFKNNPNVSDNLGQKKLKELLVMINEMIQTDHYKIPFIKATLSKELFWFITEVKHFNSRELAKELSDLQEKLAN